MNTESRRKDIILLVDDSSETISMLNDTLDEAGLAVLVALEGSQAITIANSITPDLILLDAIMPNMDGFETCKKLKAIRSIAHIPVVFMTGLSDSASIVKGFKAGGIDYVTKPINGEELVARIKAHLANSRIAMSARSALDTAGKFLFSATSKGELLWATPQAQKLIEDSGLGDSWLNTHFPIQLQQILSDSFNREKGLLIKNGNKPMEIRYISQTDSDEYLLQLLDSDKLSDPEILRSALPVTEREADVLLWIAKGKTNRQIGEVLSMSPRTVNKHLEQIFKKLNVENRTSAAVVAQKYLHN